MRRIGHHGGRTMAALASTSVLFGWWRAPALVPLALIGVITVVWFATRRHDRRLCESCVQSIPDSPSKDAIRYKHRLRAVHLVSRPLSAIVYLSSVLVSGVLLGPTASLIVVPTIAYLFVAQRTHRQLQPWCPTCANGGTDTIARLPRPQISPAS